MKSTTKRKSRKNKNEQLAPEVCFLMQLYGENRDENEDDEERINWEEYMREEISSGNY